MSEKRVSRFFSCNNYHHFEDGETEAHSSYISCLVSHIEGLKEPEINPPAI